MVTTGKPALSKADIPPPGSPDDTTAPSAPVMVTRICVKPAPVHGYDLVSPRTTLVACWSIPYRDIGHTAVVSALFSLRFHGPSPLLESQNADARAIIVKPRLLRVCVPHVATCALVGAQCRAVA